MRLAQDSALAADTQTKRLEALLEETRTERREWLSNEGVLQVELSSTAAHSELSNTAAHSVQPEYIACIPRV